MKQAIQEGIVASIPLIAFLFGWIFIEIPIKTIFPLIILYILFVVVLVHHHKERLKN